MFKYCFFIIFNFIMIIKIEAQELYVSSEPASNMPAHSLGFRLSGQWMPQNYFGLPSIYRLSPELMVGISKKSMIHVAMYGSNYYRFYQNQPNFNIEGASIYYKYRFLSLDQDHHHFRMAAFGKLAYSNNPTVYQEINLAGDNSGAMVGIVGTELLRKLALSATFSYTQSLANALKLPEIILFPNKSDGYPAIAGNKDPNYEVLPALANSAYNYSLSAGYLTYPKKYKDYKTTNLNLYLEFLGQFQPQLQVGYIDIAPAVQLIFNSFIRLEMAYRKQLNGNMFRVDNESLNLKLEVNFFGVW